MPAQIGLFPRDSCGQDHVRSWLLSLLRRCVFRHHSAKRASTRPYLPIQYRRGITRTGELDGAKEADGG
jgi:hypothetical protein